MVEGGTPELVERLARLGIATRATPRLVDGKYCNKIGAFQPSVASGTPVLLTDVDIVFAELPDIPVQPDDGRIWARIVDCPNPPLSILRDIYYAAGLTKLPLVTRCGYRDAQTFAINCNGGFYALSNATSVAIGASWLAWAEWLWKRRNLLEGYLIHLDQIAFGLAAHSDGLAIQLLPAEDNFPTHLGPAAGNALICPPRIIHHHDRLAPDRTVLPLGHKDVDAQIEAVNRRMASTIAEVRAILEPDPM
ncbi:hypothetical protein [Azospirillum doebereinerae]